ncbi:ribonuclease HII [Priestia megaterium]|uniref:ribonuclease HII n=1 Tax=Priestia megaterium TaxID=1404 RepID=UPI002E1BB641|nr:ribonuclease HII [Priestia megaterium]MED4284984.1 ribonuclease HII [Priestia megaterium]
MSTLQKENELRKKGYQYVACIDECGRGPFAGPVVAAAVIMPKGISINRLTDSKKMTKAAMKKLAPIIKDIAISYSIGYATVKEINQLNIKQATRLAMKRAVEGLKIIPDYLLVDGTEVVNVEIPQESAIKGDLYCHGISAASVIGKVFRDEWMADLDLEYGNIYNWKSNAGYINKKHIDACIEHGLTPQHRKSWSTYNEVVEKIELKNNTNKN